MEEPGYLHFEKTTLLYRSVSNRTGIKQIWKG